MPIFRLFCLNHFQNVLSLRSVQKTSSCWCCGVLGSAQMNNDFFKQILKCINHQAIQFNVIQIQLYLGTTSNLKKLIDLKLEIKVPPYLFLAVGMPVEVNTQFLFKRHKSVTYFLLLFNALLPKTDNNTFLAGL